MKDPGFEPGNVAPKLILGNRSRKGSRDAHHWELDQDSLGGDVLGIIIEKWEGTERQGEVQALGSISVGGILNRCCSPALVGRAGWAWRMDGSVCAVNGSRSLVSLEFGLTG